MRILAPRIEVVFEVVYDWMRHRLSPRRSVYSEGSECYSLSRRIRRRRKSAVVLPEPWHLARTGIIVLPFSYLP